MLTNGALPLLQAEAKNLPLAADVLRRAVAAANPAGPVAPTANYVLGLATFLQIPDVDKDAEFNKSCELARKEEGLLTEAETGLPPGPVRQAGRRQPVPRLRRAVQAARRLHDQGVLQIRTTTRSRLRLLWCAASGAVAQLG